jgi:lipoyl(octanoyl) transferase
VSRPLWVFHLGLVPYEEARAVQRSLEAARQEARIEDVLLVLEHPPVYTRGRRTEAGELPMGEEWYRRQGIDVVDTDRGGRVTYHGPGQLVAYPVVSLEPLGGDVLAYVRLIEDAMVATLSKHGVGAGTIEGLTGVWTASGDAPAAVICPATAAALAEEVAGGQVRKIGSIGIHVSRGVTTHGLAVNVNNDLQPFEWVVPCGIEGCRMTSLSRELGAAQDLGAFGATLAGHLAEAGGWTAANREPGLLGELAAPAGEGAGVS